MMMKFNKKNEKNIISKLKNRNLINLDYFISFEVTSDIIDRKLFKSPLHPGLPINI